MAGVAKGVTRTAVFPVTGWPAAAASKRSHFILRFSSSVIRSSSSSSNFVWQAKINSSSISVRIFFTFSVTFRTAWFQWFWEFLSKAGKIKGIITCLFCATRLVIWSLFHKNRARSATWRKRNLFLGKLRTKAKTRQSLTDWFQLYLCKQNQQQSEDVSSQNTIQWIYNWFGISKNAGDMAHKSSKNSPTESQIYITVGRR